jgi:hypothetical protein
MVDEPAAAEIATFADVGVPKLAPLALDRPTAKDLLPDPPLAMGIENVFTDVSPLAQLSVPLVLV